MNHLSFTIEYIIFLNLVWEIFVALNFDLYCVFNNFIWFLLSLISKDGPWKVSKKYNKLVELKSILFTFRYIASTNNVINSNQSSEHSVPSKAYAVYEASDSFRLFEFERQVPKSTDVLIRIYFCGICHTDIHMAYNDWCCSTYPMVPGHEITGIVEQVGIDVKRFKIGDHVGVGYMIDSCRICAQCKS